MEQKSIRHCCLYRSVHFSSWDVFTIQTNHLAGGLWALLGGMVGIIFFRYGEFMEAVQVKKYLRTSKG